MIENGINISPVNDRPLIMPAVYSIQTFMDSQKPNTMEHSILATYIIVHQTTFVNIVDIIIYKTVILVHKYITKDHLDVVLQIMLIICSELLIATLIIYQLI